MLNLRSVDLNLLPVFEAAYEERNLSRAAERLAMTPSAVSHAVTRLRTVFHDELFVPQARGMLPTPAADMVYARLRGALTSVRESVAEMRGFDPKTSERRFLISIAHPLGPMIAVRLRERLAHAAPGIEVAFSTRSRPVELERGMRDGRIDAAVDWLVPAGPKFNEVTLFEDAVVAVARDGHPALRRPATIRTLKDGKFVTLRPRAEGENPVAGLQEWSRLNLHCTLEVSEFLEVFMVARESDLFGLVPRTMMKMARGLFGLRALQAGPSTVSVPIRLVWHTSRAADPAQTFLRKQVALSARDVVPKGS
jgi:LysR family transcriptional regulator, transcriptional activator for leuABCD operon